MSILVKRPFTPLRKTVLAAGFALMAGGLVFAAPASAADAAKSAETAAQHAGFAAGSSGLKGVHMHLHHALNCLVGEKGDGFDADELNPCKATGGAIPNTTDAARKAELEKAAEMARAGIAETDLAKAQADASEVQKTLTGE